MTVEPVKVVEVFFSYAHRDEKLRNELEKHLKTLKRQGYITTWHDKEISPGKEWDYEINKYLDKAHIILLLISADFLASDYCDSVEVKRALQRHENGECRVIPIILRPVSWRDAAFKSLQALPRNGRPVTDWQNRDKAFVDVAEGIKEVVEEIFKRSIAENRESGFENQQINANESRIIAEESEETVEKASTNLEEEIIEEETIELTAEDVTSAWDSLRRRVKQKSKSGMVAAYLAYYKVIGIEGITVHPVIVIRAEKQTHYQYIKDERYKDLEWALEEEFGLPCTVRLVPPVINPKQPTITKQQVVDAWESLRRHTKQKSKSGMIAAYLAYCRVVGIGGSLDHPVVVIQPEKSTHYKFLSDENRYKDLEWSLEVEFGVPFEVKLIQ